MFKSNHLWLCDVIYWVLCCWKWSKRKQMAFVKLSFCAHCCAMTFAFVFALKIKKSCETCVKVWCCAGFCVLHQGGPMFGVIASSRWGHSAMWVETCPPTPLRWVEADIIWDQCGQHTLHPLFPTSALKHYCILTLLQFIINRHTASCAHVHFLQLIAGLTKI